MVRVKKGVHAAKTRRNVLKWPKVSEAQERVKKN